MRRRGVAFVLLAAVVCWRSALAETGAPPVDIDGYRSARFGMAEADVKKAIKADLGSDNPSRVVNDLERTTVLVVPGRTLMRDWPPATVSYILGASSSKLVQVNIVWGDDGGEEVKKIAPIATALAAYFVNKGRYAKDGPVVNQALSDGTLLAFRGEDAKGRMVVLQLFPVIDPATEKKAADKPAEAKKAKLRLSYIEDPDHPDIFRIEKGQF